MSLVIVTPETVAA
ncbi:hypothetical protein LDE46_07790, partial [Mycobacterium tuberculosis]